MLYCSELYFGIISFYCYINELIGILNIPTYISSVIKINEDEPSVDDLDERSLILTRDIV